MAYLADSEIKSPRNRPRQLTGESAMRMYRMLGVCGLGLMAVVPSAMAQKWEFGGGIGGSFYMSRDISNGSAKASAGIETNVASGVWLGENLSNKWGGEVRYDYQRGDMRLKNGGSS